MVTCVSLLSSLEETPSQRAVRRLCLLRCLERVEPCGWKSRFCCCLGQTATRGVITLGTTTHAKTAPPPFRRPSHTPAVHDFWAQSPRSRISLPLSPRTICEPRSRFAAKAKTGTGAKCTRRGTGTFPSASSPLQLHGAHPHVFSSRAVLIPPARCSHRPLSG